MFLAYSFHQFCCTPICVGEVIEVGDVTIEFLWFLVHIGYIWSFLVLTQTVCKAPVQLAILIPLIYWITLFFSGCIVSGGWKNHILRGEETGVREKTTHNYIMQLTCTKVIYLVYYIEEV